MITAVAVSRAPTRCAYCHSSLRGVFICCAECGTACHADCLKLHGSCPTLGCSARRPAPRAARIAWGFMEVVKRVVVYGGLLAIVGAIAMPDLTDCRKNGNETSAIGTLKTIGAAQALFREADKDSNGVHDYAASLTDLAEAGETGLISKSLGDGFRQNYHFQVARSETTPEFLWIAYAWPADDTSDRVFLTNHEGTIYYRSVSQNRNALIVVDGSTCKIPSGWSPVGR